MRWEPTASLLVTGFGVAATACGASERSTFDEAADSGARPAVAVPADTGAPVAPPSFVADAGPDAARCAPLTCAAAGASCGPIGDGCGVVVDCGACAAPDVCGGGGKPSTCGRGACTPTTCAASGADCGPIADGCGGLVASCGICTAPAMCGLGGPSRCGYGAVFADGGTACVPRTCASVGATCGPIADGCGGLIPSCGTCTPPQICGGGGTPSACGGFGACVPTTCAAAGKDCGPIADGCGGLTPSCGTCAAPAICGGGGVPSRCGGGAAGCVNLCLQQTVCPGGGDTIVTGMVVSPAENLPIPNAVVYVPNDVVGPLPAGVTCDSCGAAVLGRPLVGATTGPDGRFTLSNMPAGANIPLVVQLGKWRRQVTIPTVTACTSLALPTSLTRLPRNQTEGDIPLTAVSTGAADAMECVLRKVGVSDGEFTPGTGPGRIHMYRDNGALAPTGAFTQIPATGLYGSQAELDRHDMVIFDCVGSPVAKGVADQQRVIDYANKGGRVFASHYSYVWLHNIAPWSSTAAWALGGGSVSTLADVNSAFPRGADFVTWLGQPMVGALSSVTPPRITLTSAIRDVNLPVAAGAESWLTSTSPTNALLEYAFNTPVGFAPATQCGRVAYSAFHVVGSTGSGTFPAECTTGAMTAQEKVIAFMLFDLASCIKDGSMPFCTRRSCASLVPPVGCGLAGDGCGGIMDCGACVAPKTCGGGGVPFQCGAPSCVKQTCAGLGANCGPVADGCGGSIDCGPCTVPGQICGGGGASRCGGATCAPRSCAEQGLDCGKAGDTCGNSLDCGACPPTHLCIGGKCRPPTCTPATCASLGFDCGPAADGCGGLLSCGTCAAPGETCGGGGSANRCGGGLK